MNELAGKVALITGAGRGFGRAIAERFAEAGAELALNYRESRENCEALAARLTQAGRRALVVQADLSHGEAIALMARRVLEVFGRIDILVNNSGILFHRPFAESREQDWRSEIEVNIFGALRVTRALLPAMIERRQGKIINLSSQLAAVGGDGMAVYSGTKGFLLSWTKSLAREVGRYNINVNAIGPGLTNAMIAIGISQTPVYARLMRSSVLKVRAESYIKSARSLGIPEWRILARHVMPNAVSPIIVQASLSLASAILSAAYLGFLGLGAQPPTPEWGSMLSKGRDFLRSGPHASIFPGLFIMVTVLSFNLLRDGLTNALDPKHSRR